MDKDYYIKKINDTIDAELIKYQKFSLRDFILLNKAFILDTCYNESLSQGIDLLAAFVLKLPANCDLQKNLIKIIKEYLNEQDKQSN